MTERRRYRYRDLKPGDAYYEAWREYRKHRLIFWGVVMLMGLAVGWLKNRTNTALDWIILIAGSGV